MAHDDDRLLDHAYDGIQEYDNPLPGWWKWLFWASIGWSAVYVMYYHIGIGPSVHDDFDTVRAAFFSAQEAKYAGLEISEATIEGLSQDADLMGAMGKRFQGTCATCHGADAAGLAGPNLTDHYWIHGGTRLEIYRTIHDGVKGKAMRAWRDDLGPAGVLTMSAYIDSLRGLDRPGRRGQEGKYVDPASVVVPTASPPPPGAVPASSPPAAKPGS
jgi:cytochrome c oxidase cbb3-type subunit 3